MLTNEVYKNIKRIQIKAKRYVVDVLAGVYHSAFKGRGVEFEEVREYLPGDEVRSIDWNVTARMQYPFVKNFREERELSVILLIDVSASSLFGTQGQKKSELIAEIGALFSFSAIVNQDKVGLILFSDQIEKYIPPKKGNAHALRIIRELLMFKPVSKKTDISKALNFLAKVQKRKSVVFLISDFFSPSFQDELVMTSKKHEVIGVNVRDPLERQFPKIGLVQLRDLETQKLFILDTFNKKNRELLAIKNQENQDKLKKLFDAHASGLIQILTGSSYMDSVRKFFDLRRRST